MAGRELVVPGEKDGDICPWFYAADLCRVIGWSELGEEISRSALQVHSVVAIWDKAVLRPLSCAQWGMMHHAARGRYVGSVMSALTHRKSWSPAGRSALYPFEATATLHFKGECYAPAVRLAF